MGRPTACADSATQPIFLDACWLAAVLPDDASEVHVFSMDETLYEGYLALLLREQRPEMRFRGVTLDPMGVREFWPQADAFVFFSTDAHPWPSGNAK